MEDYTKGNSYPAHQEGGSQTQDSIDKALTDLMTLARMLKDVQQTRSVIPGRPTMSGDAHPVGSAAGRASRAQISSNSFQKSSTDSRNYQCPQDSRNYSHVTDGRNYRPMDGRNYPCPTNSQNYPRPTDGRNYPRPTDGRNYPCPTDGRNYRPMDSRNYPRPTDSRNYSRPTDGQNDRPMDSQNYPRPMDSRNYPRPTDGRNYPQPMDSRNYSRLHPSSHCAHNQREGIEQPRRMSQGQQRMQTQLSTHKMEPNPKVNQRNRPGDIADPSQKLPSNVCISASPPVPRAANVSAARHNNCALQMTDNQHVHSEPSKTCDSQPGRYQPCDIQATSVKPVMTDRHESSVSQSKKTDDADSHSQSKSVNVDSRLDGRSIKISEFSQVLSAKSGHNLTANDSQKCSTSNNSTSNKTQTQTSSKLTTENMHTSHQQQSPSQSQQSISHGKEYSNSMSKNQHSKTTSQRATANDNTFTKTKDNLCREKSNVTLHHSVSKVSATNSSSKNEETLRSRKLKPSSSAKCLEPLKIASSAKKCENSSSAQYPPGIQKTLETIASKLTMNNADCGATPTPSGKSSKPKAKNSAQAKSTDRKSITNLIGELKSTKLHQKDVKSHSQTQDRKRSHSKESLNVQSDAKSSKDPSSVGLNKEKQENKVNLKKSKEEVAEPLPRFSFGESGTSKSKESKRKSSNRISMENLVSCTENQMKKPEIKEHHENSTLHEKKIEIQNEKKIETQNEKKIETQNENQSAEDLGLDEDLPVLVRSRRYSDKQHLTRHKTRTPGSENTGIKDNKEIDQNVTDVVKSGDTATTEHKDDKTTESKHQPSQEKLAMQEDSSKKIEEKLVVNQKTSVKDEQNLENASEGSETGSETGNCCKFLNFLSQPRSIKNTTSEPQCDGTKTDSTHVKHQDTTEMRQMDTDHHTYETDVKKQESDQNSATNKSQTTVGENSAEDVNEHKNLILAIIKKEPEWNADYIFPSNKTNETRSESQSQKEDNGRNIWEDLQLHHNPKLHQKASSEQQLSNATEENPTKEKVQNKEPKKSNSGEVRLTWQQLMKPIPGSPQIEKIPALISMIKSEPVSPPILTSKQIPPLRNKTESGEQNTVIKTEPTSPTILTDNHGQSLTVGKESGQQSCNVTQLDNLHDKKDAELDDTDRLQGKTQTEKSMHKQNQGMNTQKPNKQKEEMKIQKVNTKQTPENGGSRTVNTAKSDIILHNSAEAPAHKEIQQPCSLQGNKERKKETDTPSYAKNISMHTSPNQSASKTMTCNDTKDVPISKCSEEKESENVLQKGENINELQIEMKRKVHPSADPSPISHFSQSSRKDLNGTKPQISPTRSTPGMQGIENSEEADDPLESKNLDEEGISTCNLVQGDKKDETKKKASTDQQRNQNSSILSPSEEKRPIIRKSTPNKRIVTLKNTYLPQFSSNQTKNPSLSNTTGNPSNENSNPNTRRSESKSTVCPNFAQSQKEKKKFVSSIVVSVNANKKVRQTREQSVARKIVKKRITSTPARSLKSSSKLTGSKTLSKKSTRATTTSKGKEISMKSLTEVIKQKTCVPDRNFKNIDETLGKWSSVTDNDQRSRQRNTECNCWRYAGERRELEQSQRYSNRYRGKSPEDKYISIRDNDHRTWQRTTECSCLRCTRERRKLELSQGYSDRYREKSPVDKYRRHGHRSTSPERNYYDRGDHWSHETRFYEWYPRRGSSPSLSSSSGERESWNSRYDVHWRDRSQHYRSPATAYRWRSPRTPSPPYQWTHPSTRSRSPPHRRSRSPLQRSRSPLPIYRSRSPKRRSRSPRPRSRSPLPRYTSIYRSRSPKRRSRSPKQRSVSPRRRSRSPKRRSISPRQRSRTPKRRSRSPKQRSISPRRRSRSPKRSSRSPKRRSRSPKQRSRSPKQRSVSPRRRSRSPKQRSISPRRSRSPKRRSRSPPVFRGHVASRSNSQSSWTSLDARVMNFKDRKETEPSTVRSQSPSTSGRKIKQDTLTTAKPRQIQNNINNPLPTYSTLTGKMGDVKDTQIMANAGSSSNTQIMANAGSSSNIQIMANAGSSLNTQIMPSTSSSSNTQIVANAGSSSNTQIMANAGSNLNTQIVANAGSNLNTQIIPNASSSLNIQIVANTSSSSCTCDATSTDSEKLMTNSLNQVSKLQTMQVKMDHSRRLSNLIQIDTTSFKVGDKTENMLPEPKQSNTSQTDSKGEELKSNGVLKMTENTGQKIANDTQTPGVSDIEETAANKLQNVDNIAQVDKEKRTVIKKITKVTATEKQKAKNCERQNTEQNVIDEKKDISSCPDKLSLNITEKQMECNDAQKICDENKEKSTEMTKVQNDTLETVRLVPMMKMENVPVDIVMQESSEKAKKVKTMEKNADNVESEAKHTLVTATKLSLNETQATGPEANQDALNTKDQRENRNSKITDQEATEPTDQQPHENETPFKKEVKDVKPNVNSKRPSTPPSQYVDINLKNMTHIYASDGQQVCNAFNMSRISGSDCPGTCNQHHLSLPFYNSNTKTELSVSQTNEIEVLKDTKGNACFFNMAQKMICNNFNSHDGCKNKNCFMMHLSFYNIFYSYYTTKMKGKTFPTCEDQREKTSIPEKYRSKEKCWNTRFEKKLSSVYKDSTKRFHKDTSPMHLQADKEGQEPRKPTSKTEPTKHEKSSIKQTDLSRNEQCLSSGPKTYDQTCKGNARDINSTGRSMTVSEENTSDLVTVRNFKTGRPYPICKFFNTLGGCQRYNCRFKHVKNKMKSPYTQQQTYSPNFIGPDSKGEQNENTFLAPKQKPKKMKNSEIQPTKQNEQKCERTAAQNVAQEQAVCKNIESQEKKLNSTADSNQESGAINHKKVIACTEKNESTPTEASKLCKNSGKIRFGPGKNEKGLSNKTSMNEKKKPNETAASSTFTKNKATKYTKRVPAGIKRKRAYNMQNRAAKFPRRGRGSNWQTLMARQHSTLNHRGYNYHQANTRSDYEQDYSAAERLCPDFNTPWGCPYPQWSCPYIHDYADDVQF